MHAYDDTEERNSHSDHQNEHWPLDTTAVFVVYLSVHVLLALFGRVVEGVADVIEHEFGLSHSSSTWRVPLTLILLRETVG